MNNGIHFSIINIMKHTIQGCSGGYIAYTTGDLITQNRDDTIGWANVGYC